MFATIPLDITESGTTVEGCKMVGAVPETHESNDFSLFVSSRNSVVYVTNSIDDEVIASGKGFKSAMTNLANLYGIAVVVSADPGVKETAKIKALVGTYEPTDTRGGFVTGTDGTVVRPGDSCEQTDIHGVVHAFTVTAVTSNGVVIRDHAAAISTKVRNRLNTIHWDMFRGLMAEGRIRKVMCSTADCGHCVYCVEGLTASPVEVPTLPEISTGVNIWNPGLAQTWTVSEIVGDVCYLTSPDGGLEWRVEALWLRGELANGNMEIAPVEVAKPRTRAEEIASFAGRYAAAVESGAVAHHRAAQRFVTPAPGGTPCGWRGFDKLGYRLTCQGGRDAVHILTRTLPVAVEGTALCGFHSPCDVTDDDRAFTAAPVMSDADVQAVADHLNAVVTLPLGTMVKNVVDGGTYAVTRFDEFWVGLRPVGQFRDGLSVRTEHFRGCLADKSIVVVGPTEIMSPAEVAFANTPDAASIRMEEISERAADAILNLVVNDLEARGFKLSNRVPRKVKKSRKVKSTGTTRRNRRK